ncbi:hypothetical protein [Vulcanisaeta sp. JCM 16161]|nr:hypothetical protein [Vulcanisaeta sp. JCM 16161]
MSGDLNKIGLVNIILRYELLIYVAFILMIALIIVAVYRMVRAGSRKA